MSTAISAVIEPLIKRKIFANEEDAIRAITRDYILRQIATLQQAMSRFEGKYGMRFERFDEYLHERSALLVSGAFSPTQRQSLSRAIMQEEDDWLDWKATKEILESWLGLREETAA